MSGGSRRGTLRIKQHGIPCLQLDSTFRKNAHPKFGALKILHDRDRFIGALGLRSDDVDQIAVKFVGTMAEVESRHIQTFRDQ